VRRLAQEGDKLSEFSIAGQDRKWYWADARIEADSVVVSSTSVPYRRLPIVGRPMTRSAGPLALKVKDVKDMKTDHNGNLGSVIRCYR
jgi:hypothetical protein